MQSTCAGWPDDRSGERGERAPGSKEASSPASPQGLAPRVWSLVRIARARTEEKMTMTNRDSAPRAPPFR
eukprot:2606450-Prymnesium_polylepis.1